MVSTDPQLEILARDFFLRAVTGKKKRISLDITMMREETGIGFATVW
jgi:hypothetical protein